MTWVLVPSTTPGATATYTCSSGYALSGKSSVSCLAGGTWSEAIGTTRPLDWRPATRNPPAEPSTADKHDLRLDGHVRLPDRLHTAVHKNQIRPSRWRMVGDGAQLYHC